MAELDIIIPAYNEKENIVSVLDSLHEHVKTPYRVLICYDLDEDTTLEAIADYPKDRMEIVLVKNPGSGPHSAICAGLELTTAPAVVTHMADDDYNAGVLDYMVARHKEGYEIVTGSRFIEGGCMIGCIWYKQMLTRLAAFTMYHFARFPVRDATHGVRLFSRRVVDTIEVESSKGFTFPIEMVVKVVRLGWKVHEFPVEWHERKAGTSRFRILKWIWPYLRWYFFAYATTWLGRGPETVRLKRKPGTAREK